MSRTGLRKDYRTGISHGTNKYYYVWLDAPVGYIASTANYCKTHGLDTEKDYWKNNQASIVHFIGKDIIYFHFLFWPAMLMEAGFTLPENILVHGFLTVNGEKMSKSRGTFLTAKDFLKKCNQPEYLRYYYARSLSKKMSDINLDFKELETSVNNELVANLGNFCYRTASFLEKNFNSAFTAIEEDAELFGQIIRLTEEIKQHYYDVDLRSAVQKIFEISAIGNKFFQSNEPWKLIKEDRERAHRILGSCINIIRILSIVSSPLFPELSGKLQKQIDVSDLTWNDINFNLKSHKIGKAEILFGKIQFAEEKIFPLNLKVAQILDAKEHPNADKLLVLQISVGEEKRQLVAGIRKHYPLTELNGKKIIIVSNLKPAKLRGFESQGMLLAGDDGSQVGLLTVTDALPGTIVTVEGYTNNTSEITFDDFEKVKMTVKDGKATFEKITLKAGTEEIKAEKVHDGARIG
jgi:methionyl-tRNA synthetase